jgi:hypothetical protein
MWAPQAHVDAVAVCTADLIPQICDAAASAAEHDFDKSQRRVEALKAACSCFEAALRLSAAGPSGPRPLDKDSATKISKAVAAARLRPCSTKVR